MRIVLDFPDMDAAFREAHPFPMEFEASAGYIVMLVHRIDDKLVMTYHIARAPLEGRSADELAPEDAMMEKLGAFAALMARQFNT